MTIPALASLVLLITVVLLVRAMRQEYRRYQVYRRYRLYEAELWALSRAAHEEMQDIRLSDVLRARVLADDSEWDFDSETIPPLVRRLGQESVQYSTSRVAYERELGESVRRKAVH